MSTQCRLCGLHIADGVTSCMMCGNKNLVPVAAGETVVPSLGFQSAAKAPGQASFSKWLWAVAISLIVTPIIRVLAIVNVELPALSSDRFQTYVQSHPGLQNLVYFEIGMNGFLVISALALNFLFYTRHKIFPMLMVSYVALTVLFRVAIVSAMNSMFPDANLSAGYITIVRYLIWAGAIIPYLLTSDDVKKRFIN
ncbi:MAG: DUF2569 domain-containing protein [Acidobacteria bacterium]|nr:DUF2569 domain-containing protein [Acidobacteriota bacterium]